MTGYVVDRGIIVYFGEIKELGIYCDPKVNRWILLVYRLGFFQGYICFDWVVEVILYLPMFWYLGYKMVIVHAALDIPREIYI